MTIWPPNKGALRRPAYRALARALIDAIEAGEIGPGTQLPTHRALAFQLGLSVHTVSRAYDELSRLGIISGEVGRGSFVATGKTDAAWPWQTISGGSSVIDLSLLTPVMGEIHAQRMSQTLSQMASDLDPQLLFSSRPGQPLEEHCEIVLDWLAGCGIEATPDRVLPTNGSTSAMTIALMSAAIPGDLVVTESLGHHTLQSLTSALGLRLAGLEMDAEGVLPDDFERACRATRVKVLFVMPSGLGPTTAMMGLERRQALVAIAQRHNVLILENDAWGPLEPSRPPPLAALDPDRVFYFTGLSKCLLPGLRIAWLVMPDGMAQAVRTRHVVTQWTATPLMAEVASRWLSDGTGEELLHWQRAALAERMQLVRERLHGLPYRATDHGLHIWMELPPPWREDAFVAQARGAGVAIAAGAHFSVCDQEHAPSVRICIGSRDIEDLSRGLERIAEIADVEPKPTLAAI